MDIIDSFRLLVIKDWFIKFLEPVGVLGFSVFACLRAGCEGSYSLSRSADVSNLSYIAGIDS